MSAEEFTLVEQPLLAHLELLGWETLDGDPHVAEFTERAAFAEVLLKDRLRAALQNLNPWLDEARLTQAVGALDRVHAPRLLEANQQATDLLLAGLPVAADAGRGRTVRFIDWDHPEKNQFLAVRQFRVDVPGGRSYVVPDVVLFVNGVPLVVVECKGPAVTDPLGAAITQLRRYSNQLPGAEDSGAERLFVYNQLLVATCGDRARLGTVGCGPEHFLEWKDTAPVDREAARQELGQEGPLTAQQVLTAGVLRPAHLLDLVRNFSHFQEAGGRAVKVVARYQQFRAVHRAIHQLRTGQARTGPGDTDRRGGLIWHTQGSGKSLTMVFLVRKLRTVTELRRFKVVIVTDRTDLEKQLAATASLTGEEPRRARTTAELRDLLRRPGADLVFAMIQKYREGEETSPPPSGATSPPPAPPLLSGEGGRSDLERDADPATSSVRSPPFPLREGGSGGLGFPAAPLNPSPDILVLVDEAHRSHGSTLHAQLLRALPNCARIGFTGTPILMGDAKKTHEIFGDFLDKYAMPEAEADGATVPIRYEGWGVDYRLEDGTSLDELFDDYFAERTDEEREAIQAAYVNRAAVLEQDAVLAAKADHVIRHYAANVLPGGFKAQVVAVSRKAAVKYRDHLEAARKALAAEWEAADPANPLLPELRRLEFATIISGSLNDPSGWAAWTDGGRQAALIERFKRPLAQDGLAFLVVKSMLLTGFDAPVEQVLYLDRPMKGHELLQAVARVNRTCTGKTCGLVVDYCGVARHLTEALAAYQSEDVARAMVALRDELPVLEERHRRVLAVFRDRGAADLADREACVTVLADLRARAEFLTHLRPFLESLNLLLPRPEALPFLPDAEALGLINRVARNRYRDGQLTVAGAGAKIETLLHRHLQASGLDPKIPPVGLLAPNFLEVVDVLPTERARATELEHAVREHLAAHADEDPVHYHSLSERLEAILEEFKANWEALAGALRQFTGEIRTEERGARNAERGTPNHGPFHRLLLEEMAQEPEERRARVEGLIPKLVGEITRQIAKVDFWRNPHQRADLRDWVTTFLDDHDLVPFARQEAVAGRIVDLARTLHGRLVP